jgi:predicted nucleic acid-binding Zn ribbon protein
MNNKIRFGAFTIGEALDKMIRDYKLTNQVHLSQIKSNWSEIVGNTIAKYTTDLYLRNGVLFIKVAHTALKQELSFRKEEIKTAVNKALKEDAIQEIVIN